MCPCGVMFAPQVMCASRVRWNTSHHFALKRNTSLWRSHNITVAQATTSLLSHPVHCVTLFPFSTASKKYQNFKAIASLAQPPFVNHFFVFHNPITADITNDIIPQDASME